MSKSNDKWIFPAIIATVIATVALVAIYGDEQVTIFSITSKPTTSECQYANSFVDASGQTWSATSIEATKTGCLEAIKVAVDRAEQLVGLGPPNLPLGWGCNANSICTKGESRVTFALSLE